MDESKENIGAVRPIGWVEFFSCNQRKLTHFTMHCLQKAPTFLPPSPPRSVMLMLALLALIKANSVMNNLHRGLHLSAQSYFINQELYHQKITEQTALWTLCNPRPAPSVHFRLCSSRKFDDQVGLGTSSFYTQCLMAGTMSKLDITINTLIIVVSWLWLPALYSISIALCSISIALYNVSIALYIISIAAAQCLIRSCVTNLCWYCSSKPQLYF